MNTESAVEQARALLAVGNADKARDLLLAEGYGEHLDVSAQRAFESLFPLPDDVADRLNAYSARLHGPDSLARQKAAKELAREACGVSSKVRKRWMGNPQTTWLIAHAVRPETADVHGSLLTALAEIIRRYLPDYRHLRLMKHMLKSPTPLARAWACSGLEVLIGRRALDDILPLVHDSAMIVRKVVLSYLARLAKGGAKLPQAEIVEMLKPLQKDVVVEVRNSVADIYGAFERGVVTDLLLRWQKVEKNKFVRLTITNALNRSGR